MRKPSDNPPSGNNMDLVQGENVRELPVFLQNIIESSTEYSIIGKSLDGKILLWNEGARRLYGYDPEEVVGKVNAAILHTPEDVEAGRPEEFLRSALRYGKWEGSVTRVRKDGQRFVARVVITPRRDSNGIAVGFLLMSKDISEEVRLIEELKVVREKNAELTATNELLLQVQEQLKLQATALETAANSIMITDRKGIIQWVNPAFTTMTGFSVSEAVGQTPRILKSGRHDSSFYRNFWSTIAAGKIWQGEFVNRRKDGTFYYEQQTVTPVKAGDGTISHYVGIMCDLSRVRQAEESVRKSEERFHAIANATHDVVWDWDLVTNEVWWNEGIQEYLGYGPDEPCSNANWWLEHIHPEDRERVDTSIHLAIREKDLWIEEYRFRRGDGSYGVFFDRGQVLRNSLSEPVRMIGAMMDVSERRALEEQLRQMQKMESIGQLAGGVAHDFNNILTVIQGHASVLLMKGKLTNDLKESIEQISRAAERATGLTRQLLTFSRKHVAQLRTVSLNEIVGDLAKMLKRVLGENVSLKVNCASNLPSIRADAGMLEQILMNLAVNARDAMPKGGELFIHTSAEIIGPEYLQCNPEAKAGAHVCLSVTDTGTGISPDVLPHIFEPFFTTKDVGKGTGLGLATVYGIVRQHSGWIHVYSECDRGAVFRIYFPVAQAQAGKKNHHSADKETRGGSETILVVEDETPVRALVCGILERYGYRIIEANSGVAALELWPENQGKINLLVTDMLMPGGITGLELANKLRQTKPDLRVIFTSGYSVDVVGKNFELRDGLNFLQKPYSPRDLVKIVRTTLDQLALSESA